MEATQHGDDEKSEAEVTTCASDLLKANCNCRYRPGQHKADPKTWKANFRCALNSLPDVSELRERSNKRGSDAYRVYKMLPGPATHPRNRGLRMASRRFRKQQSITAHAPADVVPQQPWQPPSSPSSTQDASLYVPTQGEPLVWASFLRCGSTFVTCLMVVIVQTCLGRPWSRKMDPSFLVPAAAPLIHATTLVLTEDGRFTQSGTTGIAQLMTASSPCT
ncbi:uncharacterized protein LOC144017899 isoform X1 [Festucalex cinctus]